MADLTGYTAMTDAHGGESAAGIVHKYMQLVDSALAGNANVIQRIGDQVVIISDRATDILLTAQHLNQVTSDEHHFLSIHGGLHFGPIFVQGSNLFGSTVNVASRIMTIAQRGEILCSGSFLLQLPDKTEFTSIGLHKLKNVVDECELFQLNTSVNPHLQIDPVCHMQIDLSKCSHSITVDQTTYHFCSLHCKNLFAAAPGAFISNK